MVRFIMEKGEVATLKKMLITGGTVFVSQYAAQYYANKYDVYVLNRNTRPQCSDVTLIQADRHALQNRLKGIHFDVVLDITAYDAADIQDLLDALESFDDYILISSSAVYPQTAAQPFLESTNTGPNSYWGSYGTNKIAAEQALLSRVSRAYILRPPYLYGPGNNVYREAFVFDCAMQDRVFCLPGDGSMKLQFFHVRDLFRFTDILLREKPKQTIYNVGNKDAITVKQWVSLCYKVAGKEMRYRSISREEEQRSYFPFYNYEYCLDVSYQHEHMPETISMEEGLREAYEWYRLHADGVNRKPFLEYIDQFLK